MPPMRFKILRLARESPSDGQYQLLATQGALTIDARTLSISAANGTPLLHLPLSACLFGASAEKIIVVPASRAPAWALQLRQQDASAAAEALRTAGCHVEMAEGVVATAPPLTDASLEAAAAAPGFVELVAQMEAALAQRQSRGLPDLLAVRSN